MLKLNAAFSKKVPAEGEYSSKSYHASVEVELPDGLSQEQLQERIHATFAMVRDSVEAEISNGVTTEKPQGNQRFQRVSQRGGNREAKQDNSPASSKQLNYLLDLAHSCNVRPSELMDRAGVNDLSLLTRFECSKLIDELNGKSKAA